MFTLIIATQNIPTQMTSPEIVADGLFVVAVLRNIHLLMFPYLTLYFISQVFCVQDASKK